MVAQDGTRSRSSKAALPPPMVIVEPCSRG